MSRVLGHVVRICFLLYETTKLSSKVTVTFCTPKSLNEHSCCPTFSPVFGENAANVLGFGHFNRYMWPQDWKRSVFIPVPKKGNAKECSNYHTIALISHASKEMLKFSKPGFSSTWTMNFQMFKLVSEKAEEPEIKLPTSTGSSKKQESSRKISITALFTIPKPLTIWITTNCGKSWKRWEYQTTWPASWETCVQVRKQQLELDVEQ